MKKIKQKHVNFFGYIVIFFMPLVNIIFENNKIITVSILFVCGVIMTAGTIIVTNKAQFTLRKKIEVTLYIIATLGLVFFFVLQRYKIYFYLYAGILGAIILLAIFDWIHYLKKRNHF